MVGEGGSRYLELGALQICTPNSGGGHFPFPGLRPSHYLQPTASQPDSHKAPYCACLLHGGGVVGAKCKTLYSKGLQLSRCSDRITEKEDPQRVPFVCGWAGPT